MIRQFRDERMRLFYVKPGSVLASRAFGQVRGIIGRDNVNRQMRVLVLPAQARELAGESDSVLALRVEPISSLPKDVSISGNCRRG